jgi:hypothetical protein
MPLHALIALAMLGSLRAQTQQPTPTFRAATHLRVQTVRVRDEQGRPIGEMTAKDIVVAEGGKPEYSM